MKCFSCLPLSDQLPLLSSFIITVSLLALIGIPSDVQADDWPQWRGPDGTGISKETGWVAEFPASGPREAWRRNIGFGCSSVSVVNGMLYTLGWHDGKDVVVCLDAATGTSIWEFSYRADRYERNHDGGPAATPAVDGDRLYTLGRDAQLFCLDSQTGEKKWSKSLKRQLDLKVPRWGFSGSPVVVGDFLLLDLGRIVVFDKFNGKMKWVTKDYGSSYSTPLPFQYSRRSLVAAFPSYGLVVLDFSDGRELTKYPWETSYDVNAATPIVIDDHIFISSGYDKGCALFQLDRRGLNLAWENRVMRNQMSTCILINGHLYGFDEKTLKCIDIRRQGKERWSRRGLGRGALSAAGDKLIILSEKGELIIADADSERFQLRGRAKMFRTSEGWTAPVLADGRIYCRSGHGELVCIDVGPKQ